jgi:hypothetical protein
MYPGSQMKVLRLSGETKLGKSHLLTNVFPTLARRDFQARYAVLDLRNAAHTICDILHMTCAQLDGLTPSYYSSAYQEWINRPKVGIQQLYAIFSHVYISAKNSSSDLRLRENSLVTAFIKDLKTLNDKPLLLFFDSVERADESIQIWLMDTLLVQLSMLPHVRVVVAGRSLREPSGSYAAYCRSYQLLPVEDVEAYISYCKEVNVVLSEQSIRDFALAFGYKPGLFVDYVLPAFATEDVSRKVYENIFRKAHENVSRKVHNE